MEKRKEKLYPYILPVLLVLIFKYFDWNFIENSNLRDALSATITVTSLVIGFLGAVLPVVMSMKNDSRIVQYVFEQDRDKLFVKYIKQTLFTGIILILVSLSLYFKADYKQTIYYKYAFFIELYFLLCFLLCTYRCLSNVLNLIFHCDNICFHNNDYNRKTEEEKEYNRILLERQISKEETKKKQ